MEIQFYFQKNRNVYVYHVQIVLVSLSIGHLAIVEVVNYVFVLDHHVISVVHVNL